MFYELAPIQIIINLDFVESINLKYYNSDGDVFLAIKMASKEIHWIKGQNGIDIYNDLLDRTHPWSKLK
jgi:hypothetical protein